MTVLSKFLKDHLKQHLFNSKKSRDGETFDQQLERILREGIFLYRKRIIAGMLSKNLWNEVEGQIANALIRAEDEARNVEQKTKKTT